MIRKFFPSGSRERQTRRLLPAILAVLGALGGAGAGSAGAADQSGAAAVARTPAAPQYNTQYNIIPLSDERLAAGIDINARGQVLINEQFEISNLFPDRVRLYDGRTVRTISPLDEVSWGSALNDLGQAIVHIRDRAFRWSRERGLEALAAPGSDFSVGRDINKRGDIAGVTGLSGEPLASRALLWPWRGPARDLGTLGGAYAQASALNDAGTVVGLSDTPSGQRPFRWTASTGMQPLGRFGGNGAGALDINAAGHIVGATHFRQGGPNHAFLLLPRQGLFDLGTGGGWSSAATRMNERGMVIGQVNNSPAYRRAFAWTRETGLIQIGRGSNYSVAADLNNWGQVVGTVGMRAFLWTRGGGTVDLNTRLRNAPDRLVLDDATAINDAGEIVANTNTGVILLTTRPVSKLRPVLGPIQQPDDPRAGALLTFSASFTDADPRDLHTATWDWGDGATSPGIVSERNGRGIVSGQHVYESEGFEYTIVLTVTDSSGKRSSTRWDLIVLPAPDYIAGQGSLIAPPGAAGAAGGRPGVARFAFMSPPAKDAQAAGRARVRFDTPGMRFRSSKVDSMEAQGLQVRYRGSGSLNGKQGYQFMLAATRAAEAGRQVERAHVRIWHRDPRSGAEVVDYDNAPGAHAAAAGSQRVIDEAAPPAGFD